MKGLLRRFMVFAAVIISSTAIAQTTISTIPPLTANNGSTAITFEVSSSSGVNITAIANTFNTGTISAQVWYRPGGVLHSGATTPSVTTANGWILAGSATVNSTSNTTPTNIPITNLNIPVNAGSDVGICVTGGTRYMTYNSSLANTFSGGGATIKTGPSYGFGGSFPSPTIATRSFVGSITVVPQGPCTNPPYMGNAIANPDTVCSGAQFVLGVDSLTGGTGQTFQWQISSDGTTWSNITGATSASYNASQSTSNYYRCYATCTASDTTTPVYVHVLSAITVPYTQDFDGAPASNNTTNPGLTDCWQYYETPGHPGYGYTYSSLNPRSAPNHMRFYSSSGYGDTLMIISPPVNDLDDGDKQVTFWAKSNTSSYNSPVAVGTMASPSDPSSLNILATVQAPQDYTEFIVPIDSTTGYNGSDLYIAIIHIIQSSPITSLYVDDITIENIPACPKPLLPSLGTATSSSQVLNWVSSGSQFVIEYGPSGFTQGTGQLDTVTTTTATLTGLAPNTLYDAYILNDCSAAGNGLSVWTGPITFKTLCTAQLTPLLEGFESADAGSSVNMTLPDCWDMYEAGPSTAYGYATSSTTQIRTGSRAYYTYCVGSANDTFLLISPEIAGMDTAYKRIEMWIRAVSTSTFYDNKVVVGTVAGPDDPGSFDPIDTLDIGVNTTYQYYQVYFDPANGYNQSHKFIALMTAGAGSTSPTLVTYDDITISNIPACTPSSGLSVGTLTNVSADLNWIGGDGVKYQIEYGPTGFTQGTGPVVKGITSTSYTITNLVGNTCYDAYVRDSCSDGTLSPWFGPITFCTPCDPQSTPISEDFENVTGSGSSVNPNEPDCWNFWRNPTATYYGYTDGATFAQPNGTYHWRFYQFNNIDTISLISPAVNGLNNGDKRIRFKCKSYYTSTSYPDGIAMQVGTCPNPNDIRGGTVIDTVYGDYGPAYTNEFQVFLDTASGYNGTDNYVFMRPLFESSKWYAYNFVDDIVIEDIPSCLPPWNLAANNITSSGATIDWATLQGTCFKIEYGPAGFIQGTGNGITVSNVTAPYTLTGLNPATSYDVYVADCCDSTNFAGPITFQTLCLSQLNGAYTVGGPTADFTTLDSAMTTLTSCGVSGPVTFNLQGGTHIIGGQLIDDNVAGLNSTNTVTISGGGPAVDTILFGAGATMGFDFDGGGNFSFEDVTINGSATQRTFWLHNGANNISFDNCHLWNSPSATLSSTGVIVGSSTSTSNFSSGDNASDISIVDCKIVGGYAGVIIYGQSTTAYNSNITVDGCTFEQVYYYAMRFYYMEDITVVDNVIDPTSLPIYGMYSYYWNDIQIERNQLHGTTSGLYSGYVNIYRSDTPSVRSTIKNNFISGTSTYANYNYAARHLDFTHNSVNGSGTYGAYFSATTSSTLASYDVHMYNNIFVGGNNYSLYCFAQNFQSINSDYNIFNTGGANLAYWNSAQVDLAALQAADSTQNQNSLSGDPGFISATDLHIVGTLPNDVGLNGYATDDIDGDSRPASGSTTVDVGADEFTPLNDDAALEAMIVKLAGCGDSATEVSAVVRNFGLNNITSLPVTVDVTGGVTATLNTTYTTTIPAGDVDTILVGSINTYNGVIGVMFEGYTALANDQKTTNDTMMVGPGNYIPVEPQYFPEDSVCANVDSAFFAAVPVPGIIYGWYANAADTVPVATGDTFTFPMSGQQTWYLAYEESADSLTTTYAGGNGQSGNAFELLPTNALSIQALDIHIGGTGTESVNVYYYLGSVAGNPGSVTWTLHESFTGVQGAGVGNPTNLQFSSPLTLPGGQTSAMLVVLTTSTNIDYTNGSSVGAVFAQNADLTIYEGWGISYGSATSPVGGTFTPRNWNGTIYYGSSGCSNIKQTLTIGVNTDTAVASAFQATVQANGADVDFDASGSIGDLYTWDFGDGNSGTGMMTSHTYATGGTYTVCLTVEDTVCGSIDSVCQTVVTTIGLDENLINQTMAVYPNPNNGNFRVEFQVEGLKEVELRVVSLLGQVMYESKPGNISGTYREEIDLSDEAAGVYVLQVISDDATISRRITIRK